MVKCMIIIIPIFFILISITGFFTCYSNNIEDQIKNTAQKFIFADMHAHPDRFHRADIPSISSKELNIYRRNLAKKLIF